MALSALPLFHRVAGQRVVVVGEGAAAEAKRRLVERAGGLCCGESEAHHAGLALIALDDPREAEAAALRLRGKGLLINVADRPELCDFTLPSVLERGPVVVAVGTGGASAGLAKQLRLRLESMLPQSLGALAEGLQSAKAKLRERWPDPAERRRALDAALKAGGLLDPLAAESLDRIERWVSGNLPEIVSEHAVISLWSENPDDLTLRQARLLGEADVIVHERGIPDAILSRSRADAERIVAPGNAALSRGLVVHLQLAASGSRTGAFAIVPSNDLNAATPFWERMGFARTGGADDYRIMTGWGCEVHLTQAGTGPWQVPAEHNPFGLFIRTPEVDAIAARMDDLVIRPGGVLRHREWGMYEVGLAGPDGLLVRVGWPSRLMVS